MRLHTTVGPSETSFAAVAEAAGVTRLTLYRHFAGRDELFAACMSHWRAAIRRRTPAGGRQSARSRLACVARSTSSTRGTPRTSADLYPLYRDAAFTPASTHRARRENIERMADAILASSGASASHSVRAAIGHVLGFWAWRSLAVEEGCSHAEAVELAVRFVLTARPEHGSRVDQMHLIQRHAWWGLMLIALTLVIFGIIDVARGAEADRAIARALSGMTPAELETAGPEAYRLFDFFTRVNGWSLVLAGTMSAAVVAFGFRRGHRWAWWATWALPIWSAGVAAFSLVAGIEPGQTPPPPMISGPIAAVLCAVLLAVTAPSFFGTPSD